MIKVRWTLNEPPLKPAGWHRWQIGSGAPASAGAADDTETEERLGWPPGTLQVLRQGFRLKLPRQTGWSDAVRPIDAGGVGSIRPGHGAPVSSPSTPTQAAARVYKRGVAYVRSGDAAYETQTLCGAYEIPLLSESASPIQKGDHLWTVVDGRVAHLWPQMFAQLTPCVLTLNEHSKSLASVGMILKAWRECGQPRRWQIVGGGLLSDVAAFAASLVGAEFDLVPTTLLAMVDAGVGGKTGVNFPPFGKNQVGAWAFPKEVRVWSPWLSTLPERELRAGAVEALKHAFLLGDLPLAKKLTIYTATKAAQSTAALLEPLIRCKATIVERDPAEQGQRAVLNLGHTLGHALEGYALEKSQDEQQLLHGEAVGFGLIYALRLSERIGGLSSQDCGEMTSLVHQVAGCLNRATLAHALGESDLTAQHVFDRLLQFMGLDKKNIDSGEIRWVLLSGLGEVYRAGEAWTVPVASPVLREVWAHWVASLPDG